VWDKAESLSFGRISPDPAESLKPTSAESGFRPELSNPKAAERGFETGSCQKFDGRTGERGRERLLEMGETGTRFNRGRVFLSICFE
jgi:hypothetical protein